METKYNYVIFGAEWDLYECAFSELNNKEYAIYIPGCKPPRNTLKGKLYRMHFRPELNRYIKIPLKNIWNRFYFENTFKDNKPICFIFLAGYASYANETNFQNYLRKEYPNCKLVLYLTDLLSKTKCCFQNKPLDIKQINNTYDMVLSYDKSDCANYNFTYYPSVFSHINIPNNNKPICDVYFAAKYKGRLPIVINIYDKLTEMGLICDFYLYKVPTSQRIYRKGIHYIEKMMTYKENLQHVESSKCLLEIIQSNAEGYTYRTWEAISYNKYLITNNLSTINAPFYDANHISVIKDSNDLNSFFIEQIKRNISVNYNYSKEISPLKLVEFIDNI